MSIYEDVRPRKISPFRSIPIDDLEGCYAIEQACFGKEAWPREPFMQTLRESAIMILFKNMKRDMILGFVTGRLFFSPKDEVCFYISFLEVLPEFQKKRIGTQLLGWLEDGLFHSGITKVFLNARAEVSAFYFKKGYSMSERWSENLYEKKLAGGK